MPTTKEPEITHATQVTIQDKDSTLSVLIGESRLGSPEDVRPIVPLDASLERNGKEVPVTPEQGWELARDIALSLQDKSVKTSVDTNPDQAPAKGFDINTVRFELNEENRIISNDGPGHTLMYDETTAQIQNTHVDGKNPVSNFKARGR